MEPKAKTLQQRFGFMDNDLKTQAHDQIMMWLHSNIKTVILEIFQRSNMLPVAWSSEVIERAENICREKMKRFDVEWLGLGPIPQNLLVRVGKMGSVEWEHPIKDKNYIIGFIDMKANCSAFSVGLGIGGYHYTLSNFNEAETDEHWNIQSRPPHWLALETQKTILFEVKSSIPSVGELLRQINMYRSYVAKDDLFVVVSPDARYASILKDQGVEFIQCPAELPTT